MGRAMERRALLAAAAAALPALAGCSGLTGGRVLDDGPPADCGVRDSFDANRGDLPPDETPTDGIPPAVDAAPPAPDFDVADFARETVAGRDVPLVSPAVAYYWWTRGAARFVDARTVGAYDDAHVYGAVPSPAGGVDGCDPVPYWPSGDRIICYGGADDVRGARRAAVLADAGFEDVYALDGGFAVWRRRDHPVAGTALDA